MSKAKTVGGILLLTAAVLFTGVGLFSRPPKKEILMRATSFADAEPTPVSVQTTGRIRVNQCAAEELETLKGIGPALAAAWIAEREKDPFFYPEDLLEIKGIGIKKLESVLAELSFE